MSCVLGLRLRRGEPGSLYTCRLHAIHANACRVYPISGKDYAEARLVDANSTLRAMAGKRRAGGGLPGAGVQLHGSAFIKDHPWLFRPRSAAPAVHYLFLKQATHVQQHTQYARR